MSTQTLAVPEPKANEMSGLVEKPTVTTEGWPPLKVATAVLYARGYSTPKVKKQLIGHGVDPKQFRSNLRRWKKDQQFLDCVWQLSLQEAELAAPSVVQAMLKKSQRGDVMAAKFFLELIGRYSPKPENVQASVINLVVPTAIERPAYTPETSQTDDAEVIRGEVLREEE